MNRHTVAELQTLEHAANNSIYNKPYNHAIMHAKEIYKKKKQRCVKYDLIRTQALNATSRLNVNVNKLTVWSVVTLSMHDLKPEEELS